MIQEIENYRGIIPSSIRFSFIAILGLATISEYYFDTQRVNKLRALQLLSSHATPYSIRIINSENCLFPASLFSAIYSAYIRAYSQ